MFSRISRYRKLPDVVTVDARGRSLASKSLRLQPDVTGTFQHTVEDGDRLDHLAYKYYQQPRKWWRIVDANPQLRSVPPMLGRDPIATTRFPLTFAGAGEPPWAAVAQSLSQRLGVEGFGFVDDVQLVTVQQTIAGQPVTVHLETHDYAALVTHNQLTVSMAELADLIETAGFGVAGPETIGLIGKQITIPPDVVG
jgi:hypothetical protein